MLIFRGGLLLSKCHHVKEKRETKETRKGETRKGETKERELKTRCKHINIPQPGGNKGKKERREKKRSEKKKKKDKRKEKKVQTAQVAVPENNVARRQRQLALDCPPPSPLVTYERTKERTKERLAIDGPVLGTYVVPGLLSGSLP